MHAFTTVTQIKFHQAETLEELMEDRVCVCLCVLNSFPSSKSCVEQAMLSYYLLAQKYWFSKEFKHVPKFKQFN